MATEQLLIRICRIFAWSVIYLCVYKVVSVGPALLSTLAVASDACLWLLATASAADFAESRNLAQHRQGYLSSLHRNAFMTIVAGCLDLVGVSLLNVFAHAAIRIPGSLAAADIMEWECGGNDPNPYHTTSGVDCPAVVNSCKSGLPSPTVCADYPDPVASPWIWAAYGGGHGIITIATNIALSILTIQMVRILSAPGDLAISTTTSVLRAFASTMMGLVVFSTLTGGVVIVTGILLISGAALMLRATASAKDLERSIEALSNLRTTDHCCSCFCSGRFDNFRGLAIASILLSIVEAAFAVGVGIPLAVGMARPSDGWAVQYGGTIKTWTCVCGGSEDSREGMIGGLSCEDSLRSCPWPCSLTFDTCVPAPSNRSPDVITTHWLLFASGHTAAAVGLHVFWSVLILRVLRALVPMEYHDDTAHHVASSGASSAQETTSLLAAAGPRTASTSAPMMWQLQQPRDHAKTEYPSTPGQQHQQQQIWMTYAHD